MDISHKTAVGRWLVGLVTLTLWGGSSPPTSAVEPPQVQWQFLQENCLDCHAGSDPQGSLNLETVPTDLNDAEVFDDWVRIYDRVRDGEMPPADYAELPAATTAAFLDATADWLVDHQSAENAELGRVRGRRLTNLQLERTLQDLLAIDIPLSRELPEEPRTGSYTTLAARQSISHFSLQQHLRIVDLALDEAFRRALEPRDFELERMSAKQISRTRTRTREPEFIDGCAVVWSSRLTFYGRLPATAAEESGWYRYRFEVESLKQPAEHGVWCTVRSGKCVSSAPLMDWVAAFEATEQPKVVEVVAWLPAGHMLEIRPADATLEMAKFAGGQSSNGEGGKQDVPGIRIHWLESQRIHRNGNDATVRQALFGEDENVAGRLLVKRFAEAAFRRPLTAADVAPFLKIFEANLPESTDAPHGGLEHSGDDSPARVAEALRAAYRAVLCSARFLYLIESPGELDGFAVASRLSYLLWNTLPDQTLLKAAAAGQLSTEVELLGQLERMLADERGQRFLVDFADQWLELRDIDFTEPDRRQHPDFDEIVQQSMLAETRLFLQRLLDDNASVCELVQSNWTFANSRLARYYDLSVARQAVRLDDQMQVVSLAPEDHRGGLLTHGSILKVTANGTNTSPVLRGVWASERILGQPIPPPPDSVPAIEPDIRGATTIREQLALHRDNAQCASCHVKIDPPGFALENFDAAGQWRAHYPRLKAGKMIKGSKIDASYETPRGEAFTNIAEFCKLVAHDPEPLARGFAEHLLCYGTGAETSFADRPAIEAILAKAEPDGYGLRSILKAAVASPVFLNK